MMCLDNKTGFQLYDLPFHIYIVGYFAFLSIHACRSYIEYMDNILVLWWYMCYWDVYIVRGVYRLHCREGTTTRPDWGYVSFFPIVQKSQIRTHSYLLYRLSGCIHTVYYSLVQTTPIAWLTSEQWPWPGLEVKSLKIVTAHYPMFGADSRFWLPNSR